MATIPQVRELMSRNERVGMGFNSTSGLAVGTPFDMDGITVEADPHAPGQVVFSTITVINTHEELTQSMGLSVGAKGRYGFFSASLKAEFSETTEYNSTSTFLLAKVIVQNPFKRGRNFRLTDDAKAVLGVPGTGQVTFQTAFGDSFVRGLQTGGEFFAVIRITSVSSSTERDLAASLEAAYNGLVTSAEFKGKFTQANQNTSTRSELNAMMYQRAGTGEEISPTIDVDQVLARVKKFPTIVLAHPVAYETEVATYDTLPLPLPTPQEQEGFLVALGDAQRQKLHYIQTKNDLEFARRNPEFFTELPTDEVLRDAIETYTQLINAVMSHGIELSTGRLNPPRIFDPSSLTPPLAEPAPIALQRLKSEGLTLVASPQSFPNNVERILFDVPDDFQATVKLTVDWGGPVAPGFGHPGIFMSARVAGIGIVTADGKKLDGNSIRLTAAGAELGRVGGNLKIDQMFDFVPVPFVSDTVHIRITVNGRRLKKKGEFSTDGEIFTPMPGASLGGSGGAPAPAIKLVLFAWSRDDVPVKVEFSAPVIVPLET